MSKPFDKQGKRTFDGIMPEYWHRLEVDDSAPLVDVGTYFQFDYGSKTEVIAAVIEVEYKTVDKEDITRIEQIYPFPLETWI